MATPTLQVVEYLGVAERNDRFFSTEVPEPGDGWWAPYPDRPDLGLELDPAVVQQHAVP